jgi:mandelate racemase
MERSIAAGASDYAMLDVMKIGGVTGWLRAAALAAERGIKMSSHLYSEASAHLLAATPTCHYLEYVDWAEKLLQEPLKIVDGHAVIPDSPGSGVVWVPSAVEKYRV